MENRLRLGQFVGQRQGISFVGQWIDGLEFSDKQHEREQLTRIKENLDKERKTLAKKKTFLQQQLIIDETNNHNSNNPTPQRSSSLITTLCNGSLTSSSYRQTQLFSDNSNDGHYIFSLNSNLSNDSSNSLSSFILSN